MKIELKILDPRLPGWGFPSRGIGSRGGARPPRLYRRSARPSAAGARHLDQRRHRLSHWRPRMVRAGAPAFRPRSQAGAGSRQYGRRDRRRLRGTLPHFGVEPQSGAERQQHRGPAGRPYCSASLYSHYAAGLRDCAGVFGGERPTGRWVRFDRRRGRLSRSSFRGDNRTNKTRNTGGGSGKHDSVNQEAAFRDRGGARHRL